MPCALITQRRGAGSIRADEVTLDNVAGLIVADQFNATRPICGDHVARTDDRPADGIIGVPSKISTPCCKLPKGLLPVRSVPMKLPCTKLPAVLFSIADAHLRVSGDHIARARRRPANGIVGAEDDHAVKGVAQSGCAVGVGADKVALHDIVVHADIDAI